MKKATIRITKGKRVRRPDFLARMKKIFGKKRLKISGAEQLSAEREERF